MAKGFSHLSVSLTTIVSCHAVSFGFFFLVSVIVLAICQLPVNPTQSLLTSFSATCERLADG